MKHNFFQCCLCFCFMLFQQNIAKENHIILFFSLDMLSLFLWMPFLWYRKHTKVCEKYFAIICLIQLMQDSYCLLEPHTNFLGHVELKIFYHNRFTVALLLIDIHSNDIYSAGNSRRSTDIVRPNFENVWPILHYDWTRWPNISPAHLELSSLRCCQSIHYVRSNL